MSGSLRHFHQSFGIRPNADPFSSHLLCLCFVAIEGDFNYFTLYVTGLDFSDPPHPPSSNQVSGITDVLQSRRVEYTTGLSPPGVPGAIFRAASRLMQRHFSTPDRCTIYLKSFRDVRAWCVLVNGYRKWVDYRFRKRFSE